MKRLLILGVVLFLMGFVMNAQAAGSLTLASGIDDTYSEALSRFQKETGLSIKTSAISQRKTSMVTLLTTRDSACDVYRLYSDNNTLKALAEKGYGVDLTDVPEIGEFVGQLLPEVINTITLSGQIIAIPTSIGFPYVFSYNPTLLEECGLTEADLPPTLLELLDFVDDWNESAADDYPHVTPFYAFGFTYQHDNPYLGLILEMYRDGVIAQTGTLSYDTDLFRRLLRRIEKYDINDRYAGDVMYEVPQPDECLFYCCKANTSTIFLHTRQVLTAPLPLAEDVPARQPFYLECAFVNPYSSKTEQCKTLLSYYAAYPNKEMLCAISLSLAAPIEKPSFEEDYRSWERIRARAETMLLSDTLSEQERAKYEHDVEWAGALLANPDEHRYIVAPGELAAYQENLVPILFSRGSTIYDFDALNQQLKQKFDRYADGSLNLEGLIMELDQTILLAVQEEGNS